MNILRKLRTKCLQCVFLQRIIAEPVVKIQMGITGTYHQLTGRRHAIGLSLPRMRLLTSEDTVEIK